MQPTLQRSSACMLLKCHAMVAHADAPPSTSAGSAANGVRTGREAAVQLLQVVDSSCCAGCRKLGMAGVQAVHAWLVVLSNACRGRGR